MVKVSYKFLVCRQDLLHSVRKDAAQLGLTIRPRLPVAATVAEPQVAQEEQPTTADTQPSPADSPGQHTVYTPNELCYLRTKSGRLGVLQIHRAFQSNWACSLHCFCSVLLVLPYSRFFPGFSGTCKSWIPAFVSSSAAVAAMRKKAGLSQLVHQVDPRLRLMKASTY